MTSMDSRTATIQLHLRSKLAANCGHLVNIERAKQEFREVMASPDARSKIGRFREVFPLVEAALRAGVSRTVVIERLAKLGLDLSPGTFKNYLERVRGEARAPEPPAPQARSEPVNPIAAPAPALPTTPPQPRSQADQPVSAPRSEPVNLRAIREQDHDLEAMRREWRRHQRAAATGQGPPAK